MRAGFANANMTVDRGALVVAAKPERVIAASPGQVVADLVSLWKVD